MNKKFLGLGSNEGNRRDSLNKALDELNRVCVIEKISPVYETPAELPKLYQEGWDKPFLNLVVQINCSDSPHLFLKKIQLIEKKLGRQMRGHWSPRTIDIDILFWGDEKIDTPDLQVPHPLIENRSFVLDPLKDLNNHFLHAAREHSGHQPLWMKVINLTPDSFSNLEAAPNPTQFKKATLEDFNRGVHIFDIGAESTRPHAQKVETEEEWMRLKPFLVKWKDTFSAEPIKPLLSLDTYKPEIAKEAIPFGVQIFNDVSGLQNTEMLDVLQNSETDYVLTHSLGIPANAKSWEVSDPVSAMKAWLEQKLEVFSQNNISHNRIFFDPGIGFGKDSFQSISILNHLEEFKKYPVRLMVGHSRKSFMTNLTSQEAPHRDIETLALSSILIQKGVDVLRIHNSDIHIRAQKVSGYVQSRAH